MVLLLAALSAFAEEPAPADPPAPPEPVAIEPAVTPADEQALPPRPGRWLADGEDWADRGRYDTPLPPGSEVPAPWRRTAIGGVVAASALVVVLGVGAYGSTAMGNVAQRDTWRP